MEPVTPRRAVLVVLSALAWGGAAGEARADVASVPIPIDAQGCPAGWDREIRLALAVELGDEGLAGDHPEEPPADPAGGRAGDSPAHTLSVRCEQGSVRVAAYDAKTQVTLDRMLNGDLPEATAPRVIALVAAELLTTFDPALRRRREPPAKPPPVVVASPPAPAPPAPPTDERRLSLTAGSVYRTFLSSGGISAWGGVLDARHAAPGGRWSIGFGFEIAGADRSTSIGQTSALLASARVGAGMRVGLAGDRLALSFDLGARGGAVRLSGSADDPNVIGSTAVHPWGGPAATVGAELDLSWFCVGIAAEAGWAAVSASGLVDGGSALAASGPWLSIALAVGARP